jgi:hypothetical protein
LALQLNPRLLRDIQHPYILDLTMRDYVEFVFANAYRRPIIARVCKIVEQANSEILNTEIRQHG